MATTTAIAIYFLIWWIVLFAVLPWGVRAQGEGDGGEAVPGTDPGAPGVPRVMAKLIWTTAVAGVVWGICAYVYVKGLVTIDGLAAMLGFPQPNR